VLQQAAALLACSLIQYMFHDAARKYGMGKGLEEMEWKLKRGENLISLPSKTGMCFDI
jgi:hypothetical protein